MRASCVPFLFLGQPVSKKYKLQREHFCYHCSSMWHFACGIIGYEIVIVAIIHIFVRHISGSSTKILSRIQLQNFGLVMFLCVELCCYITTVTAVHKEDDMIKYTMLATQKLTTDSFFPPVLSMLCCLYFSIICIQSSCRVIGSTCAFHACMHVQVNCSNITLAQSLFGFFSPFGWSTASLQCGQQRASLHSCFTATIYGLLQSVCLWPSWNMADNCLYCIALHYSFNFHM